MINSNIVMSFSLQSFEYDYYKSAVSQMQENRFPIEVLEDSLNDDLHILSVSFIDLSDLFFFGYLTGRSHLLINKVSLNLN